MRRGPFLSRQRVKKGYVSKKHYCIREKAAEEEEEEEHVKQEEEGEE